MAESKISIYNPQNNQILDESITCIDVDISESVTTFSLKHDIVHSDNNFHGNI